MITRYVISELQGIYCGVKLYSANKFSPKRPFLSSTGDRSKKF